MTNNNLLENIGFFDDLNFDIKFVMIQICPIELVN